MHTYKTAVILSLLLTLLLAGCATSQPGSDYVAAYESALTKYQGVAANKATIEHFMNAYENFENGVKGGSIGDLYAPSLYFCDTLKVLHKRKDVLDALTKSLQQTDQLHVHFLGYSQKGPDVFVRWRMTTVVTIFGSQRTATTIGMSQLRFDKNGQAIFQQDFWDTGRGIYDQIPVIGSITQYIRGRL